MKQKTWNSDYVKQRINDLGLTRKEVAKEIRMEFASFKTSLSGRKPGPQTIFLLSKVLKCSEEDLLFQPSQQAS